MKKNVLFIALLIGFVFSVFVGSCSSFQKGKSDGTVEYLAFHMINQDDTEDFYKYYNENPKSTIDEDGNLIDPSMIHPSVVIKSVALDKNKQPLNFGVIRSKTGAGENRYEGDAQLDIVVSTFLPNKETGEMEWQQWNLSDIPDSRDNFFGTNHEDIKFVAINREVGLDIGHVTNAYAEQDKVDRNKYNVTVTLDPEGEEIFYWLTSANVGRYIAIVLENQVMAILEIAHGIKGDITIECANKKEANNIATILKKGMQH